MKRQDSDSPENVDGSVVNTPSSQKSAASIEASGNLTNGPSHNVSAAQQSNEYDTWRTQPQPIYNPNSTLPDYIPSYYPSMSPPYFTGIGPESAAWSAAGQDIAYQISAGYPYGAHGLGSPSSPYIDGSLGMFGHHPQTHPVSHPASYFAQAFNYFPTSGDSTWTAANIVSPTSNGNLGGKLGKSGGGGPNGITTSNAAFGIANPLDCYGREYSNGGGVTTTGAGGILSDYPQFGQVPHFQSQPAHLHQAGGDPNAAYNALKEVERGLGGLGIHPTAGQYMTHHGAAYGVAGGGGTEYGVQAPHVVTGSGGGAPTKKSWAHIASLPAKPTPPGGVKKSPKVPIGNVAKPGDISSGGNLTNWSSGGSKLSGGGSNVAGRTWTSGGGSSGRSGGNRGTNVGSGGTASYHHGSTIASVTAAANPHRTGEDDNDSTDNGDVELNGNAGNPNAPAHPVLDKLKSQNEYNPKEFNLNTKGARYFVIKSYSEDDIHRSIKYGIWCSTEHGNKRLDNAFKEREGKGPVYLIFSVNGSGHFCGIAQMMSNVDYHKSSGVWTQDKWKGQFLVKWIYVKDVPNAQLRHIRLENNENKPVTNSRDTQEVPSDKGRQVLLIVHKYVHTTSIFDDFIHYEKRQEEEDNRKEKTGERSGDEDD